MFSASHVIHILLEFVEAGDFDTGDQGPDGDGENKYYMVPAIVDYSDPDDE